MEENIKRELKNITEYSQYYSNKFYCRNCGDMNHRYVKKGILLKSVSTECDKCGCEIKGK